MTPYQAAYYAHELTKRCSSDSVERLAAAVAGAQVDLNPHQVDAALFAFRTPLSKGALLADEVGLGKTIEAGLVISQWWAERRRRILVITPANLRKQWFQELLEKFFLPCEILETRSFNAAVKEGRSRPFEQPNGIPICSYQFARSKAGDIRRVPWDLVVIDEAHRLRNVYKPSNVIANTLKVALADRPKLLLTATPLQNSLLELYGLTSFIDDRVFGDVQSFREQFTDLNQQQVFKTLKARLRPLCHRTLRRQVTAYVPFTERNALVEEFTPEADEDRLYHLVSDYLARDNLQALPASQRTLITLVLRKLLASSTFAIAGSLASLSNRLQLRLAGQVSSQAIEDELDEDFEALDETIEEWPADESPEVLVDAARQAIVDEIADLEQFKALAESIERNAKGEALIKALHVAFAKAAELEAEEKAIIFTESRRTQDYLLRRLTVSPFAEGIVLFNGSNSDQRSREIYAAWLDRHRGSDRVTGSRTADMRSALVDYFRTEGRIMIATEAGAEGINLQFCSLVVNYDLPWNPQRIEQRIGRCHRYGQKHDVVVVNFLNRKNEADKRVYELLSEKFQLFEGVFGASDEILGSIGSGVDFEKRIADIYQKCRRPEEIKAAFDRLQAELNAEIDEAMTRTRRQLLEHFDDEVREKLRVRDQDSRAVLGRFEQVLMRLTRYELGEHAEFTSDSSFLLRSLPFACDVPLGLYELPRRSGEAHTYRLGHALAEAVIAQAKTRELPGAELRFDYAEHEGKISIVEPLVGRSGWLSFSVFAVESLGQSEDYLILAAVTDDGREVEESVAARLLTLPGAPTAATVQCDAVTADRLRSLSEARQKAIEGDIANRNARYFEAEAAKLDGWADDLKLGLEREIKDLDRQIREARRAATAALTLEEKLQGQKQVRALEAERNQKRRTLFDAQDEVDRKRQEFIEDIERRLEQKTSSREVFTVRWVVG